MQVYLQAARRLHYRRGAAAAAAKSLQSCPTLCDPTDGSPLGSPFPGILQARMQSGLPFPSPMHESESEVAQSCTILSDPMNCSLSGSSVHVFSRQEYWSGVPLPSPIHYLLDFIFGKSSRGCVRAEARME